MPAGLAWLYAGECEPFRHLAPCGPHGVPVADSKRAVAGENTEAEGLFRLRRMGEMKCHTFFSLCTRARVGQEVNLARLVATARFAAALLASHLSSRWKSWASSIEAGAIPFLRTAKRRALILMRKPFPRFSFPKERSRQRASSYTRARC